MELLAAVALPAAVALRKESVDRNKIKEARTECGYTSLSVRRAWIEMLHSILSILYCLVALRKESVDRNASYVAQLRFADSRSP